MLEIQSRILLAASLGRGKDLADLPRPAAKTVVYRAEVTKGTPSIQANVLALREKVSD
jgi:hypothetical protein